MDSQDTFINYGNFDVSNIINILNNNIFDWDEFNFRQKNFKSHEQTKTIPLLFHLKLSSYDIIPTKHYELFKEELIILEKILNDNIGKKGHIFRALLVNLISNGKIKKHIDNGVALVEPKRIHIPIITNDKCFFSVGDETKNLKVGEIWEINNGLKLHSVSNEGDEDRIHLIVDYNVNE